MDGRSVSDAAFQKRAAVRARERGAGMCPLALAVHTNRLYVFATDRMTLNTRTWVAVQRRVNMGVNMVNT